MLTPIFWSYVYFLYFRYTFYKSLASVARTLVGFIAVADSIHSSYVVYVKKQYLLLLHMVNFISTCA